MNLDYNKQDAIPKPISPTTVAALEYNQIAGSLMDTQNAAGLTADANDLTQITTAINKLGAAAGMPSSTESEELTLGASGSTYTATSNGYLCILTSASANGGYVRFYDGYYNILQQVPTVNWNITVNIPMAKGHSVTIAYANINTPIHFRFVYAEGSKSEAN